MTRFPVRRALLGAFALSLAGAAAAPLAAQAVPTSATPVRYYRGVIGLNPLGIPFDVFSIEGEGAVAPGITVGAAASYFGPGEADDRFTSGDLKFKYYPGEVALEGFGVGLGVGLTRRSALAYNCDPAGPCPTEPTREEATGPTVSVLADYNFLLGPRRRFFVGTGVGAKRWIVSKDTRDRVDAERAWVFGRFLIGMAF